MINRTRKVVTLVIGLTLLFLLSTTSQGQVAADSHVSYDPITQTWTILPTGIDDTSNIQGAFDNAAPGDTIHLTAGNFYCTHIEADDFHGTFNGAGKKSTTIDVIPGGPVIYEYFGGLQWNYFFKFEDGDFTISDMQFDITPQNPVDPWWFGAYYTSIADIIFITGDIGLANIERVGFKAHYGNYEGRNVADAIYFWEVDINAYSSGDLAVSRCSFENVDIGIGVERVIDSKILISHNSLTTGSIGIILAYTPNTQYAITKNHFHDMAYCSVYGTITADVVITNNRFTGTGYGGIFSLYSDRWTILGNNLATFNPGLAEIVLYYSSYCIVVGEGREHVLDIGGLDNIITGVNNMQQGNELGQDIKDAIQQLHELIQSMHP
ncbi:MAG: right-handed parallel beta-helix repeat-containing protein [Promethearchaeota archaeon]